MAESIWMEMVSYVRLKKIPEERRVLLIRDPELNRLMNRAAEQELAGQSVKSWLQVVKDPSEAGEGLALQLVVGHETPERGYRPLRAGGVFCRKQEYLPGCYYVGELLCLLLETAAGEGGEFLLPEPKISAEDGDYMTSWPESHPGEKFFFDNTYGGQLADLQQCQMDCLRELDRICRAHDIPYFLGGGTLLGAIRHQAIIPWDDDIDVMMLRRDYDRFVKVVGEEIGPDYHYQSNRTDPDYHSIFDKIRKNDTTFITFYSARFPRMHQGVFIDIFPQDRTTASGKLQKLHIFMTLFARSLVFHKWEGTPMHFYGRWKVLCRVMTLVMRLTPMKVLESWQLRTVTFFNRRNTGLLYDSTGEHMKLGGFPEEWLGYGRTARLWDQEFPVPSGAEEYLAFNYGPDYMTWPAPQDRKGHHPIQKMDLHHGVGSVK